MLTRELRQQAATQALEKEPHLRMAVFVDAETGREQGFLIVTVAVRQGRHLRIRHPRPARARRHGAGAGGSHARGGCHDA